MKAAAYLFDWSRTRRLLADAREQRDLSEADGGPAAAAGPGAREALLRRLTDDLMKVVNPVTGQPVVRRVMPREEAFRARSRTSRPT